MSGQFHETLLNLSAHPLMWGLAQLARRAGPLWRVPGLGVIVSGADVARDILLRDAEFTKNGPGSFAQALTAVLGPMALGNMDGADHRRLRVALSDVLAPARADMLVRGQASGLEAMRLALARGDDLDLVRFIRGWSGRIAFDVVGIAPPAGKEEDASHDVVKLSGRLASVLGFRDPSARQLRLAKLDCERLAGYFREGYDRSVPPSSLVDRLRALGLTFDQARGVLLIFVIGGTLTITAALPRIVAMLLDTGQFALLVRNPAGIQRAIDEGLRFVTPLPGTVRIAQRDVVVGSRELASGSRFIILTCNMARDPNLFPNPDQFDIARNHDRRASHLWYGAGPHFCAGFALAERELTAVLETMVADRRDLRIVKRHPAVGALLPAYERLVIRRS